MFNWVRVDRSRVLIRPNYRRSRRVGSRAVCAAREMERRARTRPDPTRGLPFNRAPHVSC